MQLSVVFFFFFASPWSLADAFIFCAGLRALERSPSAPSQAIAEGGADGYRGGFTIVKPVSSVDFLRQKYGSGRPPPRAAAWSPPVEGAAVVEKPSASAKAVGVNTVAGGAPPLVRYSHGPESGACLHDAPPFHSRRRCGYGAPRKRTFRAAWAAWA